MEDYVILISIIQIENTLEIVCYSSDFNSIYPDEKQYCHKYIIQVNPKKSIRINTELFQKDSCIHLSRKSKEINILNDWSGEEVSISYENLIEVEPPVEKILIEKISHIKHLYENEYKNACAHIKKLRDIENFLNKEIDSDNRKIDFFNSNGNKEKSNYFIGKTELCSKILEIIQKKDG